MINITEQRELNCLLQGWINDYKIVLYLSPSSPLRFHPVNMLGISPAVNQQMHSLHSRCQLGRSPSNQHTDSKMYSYRDRDTSAPFFNIKSVAFVSKTSDEGEPGHSILIFHDFDATFSDRCFPVLHLLQTLAWFNLLLNVALLLYLFQTNYYCCFPKHKVDNYLCSTTKSVSITAKKQNKNSENN